MTDAPAPTTTEIPETVAVDFPGNFRPIPGFTMDVPSMWIVGECPGALYMLATAEREDDAWANVVVRHSRVSQDVTMIELAQTSWNELTRNCPEALYVEEFTVDAGANHYVRKVIIADEDPKLVVNRSDSFTQVRAPASRTDDIFHITWLTPNWCAEEFEPVFVRMLASFKFD